MLVVDKINIVFLVRYTKFYGKSEEHNFTWELGVFSSLEEANKAIINCLTFKNSYQKKNFVIEEYKVDFDENWIEGFYDED